MPFLGNPVKKKIFTLLLIITLATQPFISLAVKKYALLSQTSWLPQWKSFTAIANVKKIFRKNTLLKILGGIIIVGGIAWFLNNSKKRNKGKENRNHQKELEKENFLKNNNLLEAIKKEYEYIALQILHRNKIFISKETLVWEDSTLSNEYTCFAKAIENQMFLVVEKMLQMGADPFAEFINKNNSAASVFDYALKIKNKKLLLLVVEEYNTKEKGWFWNPIKYIKELIKTEAFSSANLEEILQTLLPKLALDEYDRISILKFSSENQRNDMSKIVKKIFTQNQAEQIKILRVIVGYKNFKLLEFLFEIGLAEDLEANFFDQETLYDDFLQNLLTKENLEKKLRKVLLTRFAKINPSKFLKKVIQEKRSDSRKTLLEISRKTFEEINKEVLSEKTKTSILKIFTTPTKKFKNLEGKKIARVNKEIVYRQELIKIVFSNIPELISLKFIPKNRSHSQQKITLSKFFKKENRTKELETLKKNNHKL